MRSKQRIVFMQKWLIAAMVFFASASQSQPVHYTVANAHSHNDYEQKVPFWTAYNEGFGSIEADIFLENGRLYVAHDTVELKAYKTLEALYLEPLLSVVGKNKGFPFADTSKHLQLLIDIKTDSIHTLNTLIALLQKYRALYKNGSLKFVITGNRPAESLFTSYPPYIWFDGELFKNYSKDALTKIVLLSDDLKNYWRWSGNQSPSQQELSAIQAGINKAHNLHKPVRFWDAPDYKVAWDRFIHLGVDYINTDHIAALSSFLNKYR